jgi:hypothetical protein
MLKIICLATLNVKLPATCRMESRCSSSLYSEYTIGAKETGVSTLSVGLSASRFMASSSTFSVYSESCVCVGTIGVATLSVGLQRLMA